MRGFGWVTVCVLVGCAARAKPPTPLDSKAVRQAPSEPAQSAAETPEPEPSEPEALPPNPPASESPSTSAPAPTPDPAPAATERTPSAAETRECAARGGTIQPVCMLGELACVVRYRDGGKRCSDKRNCAGECLYEGPDPPPPKATGSCQRTNDPCGCKAPIHHGRVDPALCVD